MFNDDFSHDDKIFIIPTSDKPFKIIFEFCDTCK